MTTLLSLTIVFGLPLVGRVVGTESLNLISGRGEVIAPTRSEGVRTTPQGISFGYDQPSDANGVLVYSNSGLVQQDRQLVHRSQADATAPEKRLAINGEAHMWVPHE